MKISVAIECGTTGAWYGRFVDYIGTQARTFSKLSLLEELKQELQYHLSWMKEHNLDTPELFKPEIIILEEKSEINQLGESGGEVALFEFDKQSVTNNHLQLIFKYMRFNRIDLLKLVKSLTSSQLELIPPRKGRNILQILMHICNAEEWYISRMGENATRTFLEYTGISESELDKLPVFKRMESVRAACIKTLKDIVPKLGAEVFQRTEFTDYPDEKWTAYKVLRRFLEHEREHFYNIREYLGIPPRSME